MSGRHFWQWDQNHQVMIQVFLVFFRNNVVVVRRWYLRSRKKLQNYSFVAKILGFVALINVCFNHQIFRHLCSIIVVTHSVSKVHFWLKKLQILEKFENGQFLFLCQNWPFFRNKKFEKIWIFAPKLVKNFMILLWAKSLKVHIFDTF